MLDLDRYINIFSSAESALAGIQIHGVDREFRVSLGGGGGGGWEGSGELVGVPTERITVLSYSLYLVVAEGVTRHGAVSGCGERG